MKKRLFFSVILLVLLSPLSAEYNRSGIPDSSEIRKSLVETWLEAPLNQVRMNRPEVRTNSIGQKFQVRLEETESTFNIFVAPFARMEVDIYSDKGKQTEYQEVFPGDAPGSWLLVRDKKTGTPIRIRYYFASDSEVYVQFSPGRNTAYSDFVIFNNYAARGVPTGLTFERFYTASFAEIVKWTQNMLPWKYTSIYTDNYHANRQMIEVIRENLSSFEYTDDAMYDENGNPVYISTGKIRTVEESSKNHITVNGAGFLKWIADGLVEPLTGSKLKRIPLLEETVKFKETGFQGILSEKYSISFSLDWIRNLSSALVSIKTGINYLYSESGVDVTISPFSAQISEKGVFTSTGFIENTGYSVQFLKPLLYVLCATEPESFFLGAIRETDRRTPEVKVFNECVALFPYFDSDGHFKFAIFKDGNELSYDEFYGRYCLDYIYLTRAGASDYFFPERASVQE